MSEPRHAGVPAWTPSPHGTPAPSSAAEPGRQIFINYRREDTGGQARALLYALEASFPGQVFMDVKGLAPGVNYLEEIERTVATCRAVLVLIGKSWAAITDAAGRRRLDDPRDVVVLEVSAALRRNDILVIPVLVAGATLPSQEELPAALHGLLDRHCLHVTDQDWDYDVARLVDALRTKVDAPPSGVPRQRRVGKVAIAAAGALVVLLGAFALLRGRTGDSGSAEQRRASDAPRAPAPTAASVPLHATPPPQATPATPAPPPAALDRVTSNVNGASAATGASPPQPATARVEPATPARPAPAVAPGPPRAPPERKRTAAAAGTTPRADASPRSPPAAPVATTERPASAPAAVPERAALYVTSEIVTFQQVHGDARLEERGRKLFEGARWRVDPAGTLTFEPREQAAGFFPLTVPVIRDEQRISFEGSRVARASDGQGYVRIAGRLSPGPSKADASVEIEFGRASADGADRDPTYRANARLRLVSR